VFRMSMEGLSSGADSCKARRVGMYPLHLLESLAVWSGLNTYSVCSSILMWIPGAVNCWFCGEGVHCVRRGIQAVFAGPMDWLLRVLLVEGTRVVQKQHIILGAL